MSEIKPVAYMTMDGFEVAHPTDATEEFSEPLYDQSAIDRLTAERDVLLIEKGRLQGIRQKLESERDAAVADAERRLQLIRDTLANTEWRHGARNIYAEFCKESREAMKEQEQGK